LIPAQFFVDYLGRIKADPRRVVVAAIAAPTQPFAVTIDAMDGFPFLAHSCDSGTFGDPPVRIQQVLSALGARAMTSSVCQDSYAAAMAQLATFIAAAL
jgi:hypothetical protein